jgi:O-succinylbenzoate synthase
MAQALFATETHERAERAAIIWLNEWVSFFIRLNKFSSIYLFLH